jgi:hypothetical protein
MGQKTGMLRNEKKVQMKAIMITLTMECQNLNSGRRLMKGLNSSVVVVGRVGPSEKT